MVNFDEVVSSLRDGHNGVSLDTVVIEGMNGSGCVSSTIIRAGLRPCGILRNFMLHCSKPRNNGSYWVSGTL